MLAALGPNYQKHRNVSSTFPAHLDRQSTLDRRIDGFPSPAKMFNTFEEAHTVLMSIFEGAKELITQRPELLRMN